MNLHESDAQGPVTKQRPRHERPEWASDYSLRALLPRTVFWNRRRWWRVGDDGLHQLIVPMGHDDIMHGVYNGGPERRVAAARTCGCYICRDLLEQWGADGLWAPPGGWSTAPTATCDGPCGKAFRWFQLTMVCERAWTDDQRPYYRTRSLCPQCFWSRPTPPPPGGWLANMVARLWLPGDELPDEPIVELDPAFVDIGHVSEDQP
ncbi:hypothetical protein [Mycolicibacterium mageritense]|nr:hypothetical protein [Mycolicibacterium mageritense]MCC9181135.1 hypothetical protein [Mycolicibacterium mageritense]